MQKLLEEMSWDQFMGWQEYYMVEPFGEDRADIRLGIMASLFANANRDPRKGSPFKPDDFIPKFDSGAPSSGARKPITDPEEWKTAKAKLMMAGAANG